MQKIKILVLGCNSFLGFHFIREILENENFILFGTINKNSYRIQADQVTRDYKQFEKINPIVNSQKLIKILNNFQPNVVVNFIGNSNLFEKSKKKHESQNLNSLEQILNSIELSETNIEHFFNIGSSQEYKHSLRSLKESDPLGPVSEYAKSKVKCHKYALKWAARKRIKFTTLRVFNVIGNDQFKENIIVKLMKLKNDGQKVCCYIRNCEWLDIGRVEDYQIASKIFNKNKSNYIKKIK